MSLEVAYHPTHALDALIPCFRKVVKGFRDNGDYWLILHFYNGGLRAPRISDAGDKQKVKNALTQFLGVWDKPRYTGQIAFHLKHGEFKGNFNSYPGSGSFDEFQKEGIKYQVHSREDYGELWYRIVGNGDIPKKVEEDVPF